MVKKEDLKTFTKLANLIINDKRNANLILELIANLDEHDDVSKILGASSALFKVFCHLIKKHLIECTSANTNNPPKANSSNPETSSNNATSVNEMYKEWMNDRFQTACERWFELLSHEDAVVRQKSLKVLMDLLKVLTSTAIGQTGGLYDYPFRFIEKILWGLLSLKKRKEENINIDDNNNNNNNDDDNNAIIIKHLKSLMENDFKECMAFDDVRYFFMKVLLEDLIPKNADKALNFELLFCLLKNFNMPKSTTTTKPSVTSSSVLTKNTKNDGGNDGSQMLKNFFVYTSTDQLSTKYSLVKEHKKLFTNLWIRFLNMDLQKSLYKAVLVVLHDSVMPHMTSPLLLTDFLIHSYNAGGSTSLLALNGLFILMTSYNLDYPDFYGKLYTLLEPSVFHMQYRARFMYLLDLFLYSTHLSANIVGAFIKKLSRLSLTAPTPALLSIVTLVTNLLIRHPNCQTLIHTKPAKLNGPQMKNDDGVGGSDNNDGDGMVVDDKENDGGAGGNNLAQCLSEDPFKENEKNLLKTRAMESSLWEIKTLQCHYHYSISSRACRIDQVLPIVELPYKELLEHTITDLIDKEKRKKMKVVPGNYLPPNSFVPDSLNDLLSFS
ncbi:hypothetical protein HELRODRAFT_114519 [Helobdella robusta]|uniref:CCAAT-binding factor domain-containing protein n=1 Tax=Helobdella robusta TaxID=6412 RepID=T1EG23_HELRO|nr:hypothetical protein HELRODRAFT_114519 [Helobdella robusta]ESN95922.1 hypothetical protein HELRODRAFT_114519 [Helobdella robusta]